VSDKDEGDRRVPIMRLLGRVGLILLASGGCESLPPLGAPTSPVVRAAAPSVCPRPSDNEGRPLYETVLGLFIDRRIDPSGAHVLVIKSVTSAANQGVTVTKDVYDRVASIEDRRSVTLMSYVNSALAGANPVFSCVEF
jgi:hypothetical protein